MKISKIILYDEPTIPEIQLKRLEKFLIETFTVQIEIRDNIFSGTSYKIFEKIARTRIFDLKKPFEKQNKDTSKNEEMILYDGFEFHKIITELIPINENNRETLHIIFTNKLTCTFDENDFRYHARAIIGSNPE